MNILRKRPRKNDVKIVAILALRNEDLFIERCIRYLIDQGIEICVIDNDSMDRSHAIARSFLRKGVIRIERYPYKGYFDLGDSLKFKEQLAEEIDADWFIHHDADEIREAPLLYKDLKEAIMDVDSQGYNAINFDEFVFHPTDENESYEGKDYVKEMKYYYFLKKKRKYRQLNAWKKTGAVIDLASSGGHLVKFEGRKIFPVNFILRHYIFLSRRHAISKYSPRVYSMKEVKERGWHGSRATFTPNQIKMPPKEILKEYKNDRMWDKTDPWYNHYCL